MCKRYGLETGYTGKPYDAVTGLSDYGFRDYSPTHARFITEDPIRDGENWFAYVGNNPVNWVDPWGLSASDGKRNSGFTSEQGAVKDFALTYNPLSIRNNREYGSTIYSYYDKKTGKKNVWLY